jgi:hypothetical protein
MKKGDRVRVARGKSQGVEGTVFWEGPSKYGEGRRLGLKDAKDATHWVDAELVELLDAAEEGEQQAPEKPAPQQPTGPAPDASQLTKGARVRWGGGEGVIFWVGENKFGPGLRLGVTGDDEEKHWLDAAGVQLVQEAAEGPAEGAAQPPAGVFDEPDDDWANREDDRDYGEEAEGAEDGDVPF